MVIASIWLVAIVLTGYGAPDLVRWVHGSPALEDSQLVDVTDALRTLGDMTGLGAVHDQLERVRERIHKGRAVEDSDEAEAASPPSAPAGGSGSTASTNAGSGSGSGSASAPRHVVKQVLLIGASSIQFDLGVALEDQLTSRGVVVKRFGRAATGLTQPEILDWPARLDKLLDGFPADTVIINFGGNDAMSIQTGAHSWLEWGTANWPAAYGERVADMVKRCAAHGAAAVVIGMPIMKSWEFSGRMRVLNGITWHATEAAGGTYLTQWIYSTTEDGHYREYIEAEGQHRLMRNADGIHYSRWGADYVASRLIADLQRQFTIGSP